MTATKFEELMAKTQMHEREEFKSLKALNIFVMMMEHWKQNMTF
jgi:hypothetical protein